jgi:hypothetical protein
MATGLEFRGLRCFQSTSDPQAYYVVPERPELRRGADGAPLTTMVGANEAGYLMLSAAWAASEDDVEALRHELLARTQQPPPGNVRLSFAPVASVRCNALISDGHSPFQVAASSGTSGVPPYDAVFSLFLQGERLAHAKAALRGELGFLGVEYLADLRVPVSATATFDARAHELEPWLVERSCDDLVGLLEEAVERGLASVTIETADLQAAKLTVALYERVLARTAQTLSGWPTNGVPDHIHVVVRLDELADEPIRAFADVGAIVSQRNMRAITGGQDAAD